jgi:hypothetical protein
MLHDTTTDTWIASSLALLANDDCYFPTARCPLLRSTVISANIDIAISPGGIAAAAIDRVKAPAGLDRGAQRRFVVVALRRESFHLPSKGGGEANADSATVALRLYERSATTCFFVQALSFCWQQSCMPGRRRQA